MALAADTPDETISTLLGYIGKALSGERTYIFEKNIYGRDDNTYEWTAEGISPIIFRICLQRYVLTGISALKMAKTS